MYFGNQIKKIRFERLKRLIEPPGWSKKLYGKCKTQCATPVKQSVKREFEKERVRDPTAQRKLNEHSRIL